MFNLDEVYGRMDANSDGSVTKEEYMEFSKQEIEGRFSRMDENGDGKVSKVEFQARGAKAAEKSGKAHKGDGSRMFGKLDANNDGFLDKAELSKMAERRFGRMDADGDGSLSPTELISGWVKVAAGIDR